MDYQRENDSEPQGEAAITLKLLSAVETNSDLTQRGAAKDLGVALGLVNAYLKRCVRKGLIKVSHAPANRYAYYLTPKGFAEKSRLTAEYLSISFNFFRTSRSQCSELIDECARRGWRRIAFVGVSDLAEIATLCVRDGDVKLLGIVDVEAEVESLGGFPVAASLDEFGRVDAVIITDFFHAQSAYERIARQISPDRVLVPGLLNVSRASMMGYDEADR